MLVGQGILLPLDRALTSRTTADLRQTLNPRLGLEARVQYDYVDFAIPTLADGDQLDALLALNRRLGDRQAVALSYTFLSSKTGDSLGSTTTRATWAGAGRLSLTANANVNLGFTAVPQPDGSWQRHPFRPRPGDRPQRSHPPAHRRALRTPGEPGLRVRAGSHRRHRRHHRGAAVRPALVEQLWIQLHAEQGYDPGCHGSDQFSLQHPEPERGLGYRVNRRVGLDLGYSYFRSSQATPSIDDHTVSLGVVYRKEPE